MASFYTQNSSGSAMLAEPAASTTALQAQVQTVASWNSPTPHPMNCEVGLNVAALSNLLPGVNAPLFPTYQTDGQIGQNVLGEVWESPSLPAAWRIEYGSGAASRTLWCDLRSYRLYLGACDQVRVGAIRYRAVATVAQIVEDATVIASASISHAGGGVYDEPTHTTVKRFASGATLSDNLEAPIQARWWTPIVIPLPTSPLFWGSAQPDLSFYAGEFVVIRPATYAYMPPKPRFELAPQRIALCKVYSSAALSADLTVGIRFYLST